MTPGVQKLSQLSQPLRTSRRIPRPHRKIRRFEDGWQGEFIEILSACGR